MYEEELRQTYYELLKAELKNDFKGVVLDQAPLPIQLAVDKLVAYNAKDATVQSEGIGDLRQAFFDVSQFPGDVRALIKPYRVRRLEFI